jgi:hypothetical protein
MSALSKLYERVAALEAAVNTPRADLTSAVAIDAAAAMNRLERLIAVALPCAAQSHMQSHSWRLDVDNCGYICHFCGTMWPVE